MTSSCRYTYAREILSKKAIKVLSIINRSFSNTDAATIAIKNKLFNALVKPVFSTLRMRNLGTGITIMQNIF